MYNDISKKIKIFAYIWAGLGVIVSLYFGLFYYYYSYFYNFLILTAGPGFAWASSWMIYGFAEMLENSREIARNTRSATKKSETQAKIDEERIERAEKLRAKGLITEEEYRQAIYKE